MSCPICSCDSFTVVYPDTRSGRIVKCSDCGFVYSNPPLAKAPGTSSKEAFVDSDQVYLANALHRISLLKKVTSIEKGKLLDVGCFTGTFAAAAKEMGFDVFGVEMVAEAARRAEKLHQMKVYRGSYDEVDIDVAPFDVISFIHSFEHMPNPKSALAKSPSLLADNGALLIEVPNYDCRSRKLLGPRWRQFISDHQLFFTPDTIRKLLKEMGYSVLYIDTVPKILSTNLLADRIERYYSKRAGRILERSIALFGLEKKTFRLNLGDIMVVIARIKGGPNN